MKMFVCVIILHFTLAVLRVYTPASLGLTVPDYVTFSNPFKEFLDFVSRF